MKSSTARSWRRFFDTIFVDPLATLQAALASPRRWSGDIRRWRALCDIADMLGVVRPRRWQERRVRLYRHVLRGAASLSGVPVPEVAVSDLPARTRLVLRAAPSPLRDAVRALVALLVGVGGTVSVLGLALALVSPGVRRELFPPDLIVGAHWTATSAFPGTPTQGTGATADGAFFVHTEFQENPAVTFDFGKEVSIGHVKVRNRTDCCQERTLPLNVEIPEGAGWKLICQRRAPFSSWACDPTGIRASRLRFRIPGHTALHLKSVEVYP